MLLLFPRVIISEGLFYKKAQKSMLKNQFCSQFFGKILLNQNFDLKNIVISKF